MSVATKINKLHTLQKQYVQKVPCDCCGELFVPKQKQYDCEDCEPYQEEDYCNCSPDCSSSSEDEENEAELQPKEEPKTLEAVASKLAEMQIQEAYGIQT